MPLLLLSLLSSPFCADILLGSLEDQYPYRSVAQCPQADAIFVFGGMLGPRDRADGSLAWGEAAERFDRAVRLMAAGKAGTLVFSGGSIRYPGGSNEGELLRQEAINRGVPGQAVLVTGTALDTISETVEICRLATHRNWKKILFVTSAYHLPRAMYLSNQCSAERIPVPVAYKTPAPDTSWAQSRFDYYIPQARGISNSELALHEYLGTLLDKLRKLVKLTS